MTSARYVTKPFPRVDGRARALLPLEPVHAALRRALNVTCAAMGIVLALPLMAGIAFLIKLTSCGPVFYTQTRVGVDRRRPGNPPGNNRRQADYGGRLFTVYKFRTMRVTGPGAEDGAEVWAAPDDPRVTPLGRILRFNQRDARRHECGGTAPRAADDLRASPGASRSLRRAAASAPRHHGVGTGQPPV